MRAKLDGVPVRFTKDGKHCQTSCPLLTFQGFTVCALEVNKKNVKSRYDRRMDMWRRCPACRRLERKSR